jgi:hypothetical protein
MGSVKNSKTDSSGRVQKNVNVLPETADRLEELAKSRYGSGKKQGHVVDNLVLSHSEGDVLQMVTEIHSALCVDRKTAHTQGKSKKVELEQDTRLTPVEELEEQAQTEGQLDVNSVDLSLIKGARGVNKAEIVLAAMRGTGETHWTNSEIVDFVIEHAGYSYNGALSLRKEVTALMTENLLSGMDDWVRDRVDFEIYEEWHSATGPGSDSLSENKYRKKYNGSLASYLDLQPGRIMGPDGLNGYFVDREAMLNAVTRDVGLIVAQLNKNRTEIARAMRIMAFLHEVDSRTHENERAEVFKSGVKAARIVIKNGRKLKGSHVEPLGIADDLERMFEDFFEYDEENN